MDFESLSLFHIGVPLLLVFTAIHFGICFVRRDALRKALRVVAFLPIAAAAGYILWALISPKRGTGFFIDDGVFAAALVGIPALFALGGSLLGWLLGNKRGEKKKVKPHEEKV